MLSGSDFYFFTPSQTARNLLFYFTSVGHFFCDFGYRVARENYGNYLLLLVKKGRLSVETGGKKYTVREKEAALIDCHLPHVYEAVGFAEFLWIHFDGADSNRLYLEITEKIFDGPVFRPEHPIIIEEKLKNIISVRRYEQFCSEYEDSLQIYGLLMSLCGNGMAALPNGAQDEVRMEQVIRYIGEHLSEDLSVGVLADLAGLSESHFTRKFRQAMSSSPKEYLIRRRMNEAKHLLKTTDFPVKEIAARVGYRSESHFTNTFTAQNGLSPKRFREFPI